MGRRAKNTVTTVRNHSLLGWGIFLAALLGIASPQLGMSIVGSIALAGTGLVVFVLLWMLSGSRGTSNF